MKDFTVFRRKGTIRCIRAEYLEQYKPVTHNPKAPMEVIGTATEEQVLAPSGVMSAVEADDPD